MCQESVGNSLSLWERAGGEGLATNPKYFFLFFVRAHRKKDGEEFSFLVSQLRPHPTLPKGEGLYLENLATLQAQTEVYVT